MKKIFLIVSQLVSLTSLMAQNVGIGTTSPKAASRFPATSLNKQ